VAFVRQQRVVRGRITGAPGQAWRWRAAAVAVAGAAAVSLTGCAKMDAALDKQWMVVDFSPSTSVATALHVRAACSHIPNTPPMALPAKRTVLNVMYGVEFNTTDSSPANLAELQTCLGKFKSVLGVDPEDSGDEGS
jgi:hypothetical protein